MKHAVKRMSFKMDSYNEGEGIFSGYGAVFENIDSGGDVIEPGAFTKTLAEGWERVKILALHNDCWLPIGRPIELREDANGLYISAKISDTTMGKDIKVLLNDSVLNELSIGYDPIVFDYDGDGIRHLREVKLWEVSVVTWAMNPEAVITSYKSLEETADRIKAARDGLLQKVGGGGRISEEDLRAIKGISQSMKDAARMIDHAIGKAPQRAEGSVKSQLPNRETEHEIEIYF